jgi:hypothetical protein
MQERPMNINTTRLDDKLNSAVLAVIIAVVASIGSSFVSVEFDTDASVSAPAPAPASDTSSLEG